MLGVWTILTWFFGLALGDQLSAPLSDDEIDNDVVAYALKCKAELGITTPLPDLSCMDGVEIPITVDGQRPNAEMLAELSQGTAGCDKAQWLDGACWTYDLIQRVDISEKVEGVLNCRQKYYSSTASPAQRVAAYQAAVARGAGSDELVQLYKQAFEFDDLGLILRNKDTGKTCFFTFFGDPTYQYYGGWIPGPDRAQIPPRDEIYAHKLPAVKPPPGYPESMWNRGPRGYDPSRSNMFFTPAATAHGACLGCHSDGAFRHSPFVDQATDARGMIVPGNDPNLPYLPVGRVFQQSFKSFIIYQVDTNEAGGSRCTRCHRLTSSSGGAFERIDWAVGTNLPHPSATASAHPWMPAARYIDSYTQLRCCLNSPAAAGCRWRKLGPTLEDLGLRLGEQLHADSWHMGGTNSDTCSSH